MPSPSSFPLCDQWWCPPILPLLHRGLPLRLRRLGGRGSVRGSPCDEPARLPTGLTVPPVLPTAGVPQGAHFLREWGAPPPAATPPDPPVACAFRAGGSSVPERLPLHQHE